MVSTRRSALTGGDKAAAASASSTDNAATSHAKPKEAARRGGARSRRSTAKNDEQEDEAAAQEPTAAEAANSGGAAVTAASGEDQAAEDTDGPVQKETTQPQGGGSDGPGTAAQTPSKKDTKGKKKTPAKQAPPTASKPATRSTTAAAAANAPAAPAEPPKFHYEFMGPWGPAFIMLSLPVVVVGLCYACNADFCLDNDTIAALAEAAKAGDEQKDNFNLTLAGAGALVSAAATEFIRLLTPEAALILAGWMLLQVALERLLPATIALGTPVAKVGNARLPYRINAHLAFWVTLLIMGHACPVVSEGRLQSLGAFDLTVLYTRYAELAACSCLFSVFLSVVLYLAALRPGTVIADPGSSGNPIYDLFMGRELNPRIFNFDLKYFCELRPGLIGWTMLNIGCAAKQYEDTGGVSPGMLLVVFGQGMYVWDAVYYESSILTTMDVTSDGFGFMLAFGDLAWVPFIYSFQARYLVDHDPELPWWSYLLLLALHCLGYAMFRLANKQKDAFRKNPKAPEVAQLKFMQTQRGTKLLVSGWWGMARKINYTGDWLMGLSWCLCCGFDSPLPYFYATYFGVLLVHRAFRDDHACAAKYGEDWKAYKAKVPYMFIPKVV